MTFFPQTCVGACLDLLGHWVVVNNSWRSPFGAQCVWEVQDMLVISVLPCSAA